jgi:hypothetical protein
LKARGAGGGGKGEEMAHTMYAHMNKRERRKSQKTNKDQDITIPCFRKLNLKRVL